MILFVRALEADNKESIQKYGLSSLELRSTATNREKGKCDGQRKSPKADIVEDIEEACADIVEEFEEAYIVAVHC